MARSIKKGPFVDLHLSKKIDNAIQKNDKKAKTIIAIISLIIFVAVAALGRFKLNVSLPFNVHVFALINAIINSIVTVLLVAALIAIKNKKSIIICYIIL